MKDLLGHTMAALLVILSLMTLLTPDHNWEPSNEPVVHNPERVSDLGLRLVLKSHNNEPSYFSTPKGNARSKYPSGRMRKTAANDTVYFNPTRIES